MKQTDLKLIAKEVREVLNVKSIRPSRAKLAFITVALAEGYSDKGIANYLGSDLMEIISFDNYSRLFEYLYAHHFDINNLIGRGLAIDANTIKI